MLFTFLQKQTDKRKQAILVKTMIKSLNIPSDQKELYLQAVSVLSEEGTEKLFHNLTLFVEKVEMRKIEDIKKDSFESVAGMRKKEAVEKLEEMNSFSFLLHNL